MEQNFSTNELLRREMQVADKYSSINDPSDTAMVRYMISRQRIDGLNNLRSHLYKELSKTRIRAPFTGTLGISKVKPGDVVYPGLVLSDILVYEHNQSEQRYSVATRSSAM